MCEQTHISLVDMVRILDIQGSSRIHCCVCKGWNIGYLFRWYCAKPASVEFVWNTWQWMDWINSSVNPCRVDSSSSVLHPSGIAALLILPWQWINPLSSSPKLNWFITQLLEGGSDFSIFSSSEKQYCCMVCIHPLPPYLDQLPLVGSMSIQLCSHSSKTV